MKDKIVITDASCFIILDKIGGLDILDALYREVVTTPEIAAEYGKRLPGWVQVRAVEDRGRLYDYAETVDIGEASAMVLAAEIKADKLIIDDMQGRKFARTLGLEVIGTVGVILEAKREGFIPAVTPYLLSIRETNFRLSDRVMGLILREAGE